MLFASWPFVLLVAGTFAAFYAVRSQAAQTAVLIAASAVFYGYGQPWLLTLLVSSSCINGLCSYVVRRSEDARQRFAVAVFGVLVNLGILGLFKYGGLLGVSLGPAVHASRSVVDWLVALPLPIGISFYTFQGISLVVDEYRGLALTPGNVSGGNGSPGPFSRFMADTLLFIMFFPQLVAGPILKAHDFYPQIVPKRLRDVDFGYAFKALVLGYFLKLVVADNLAEQTYWMHWPYCEGHSSLILVVLLVGYSAQIFADFAGYSLIAQGCAALFGYRLFDNFNFPYIAASFSDFWRRWHISLSSWLREYLYIPLGGNRHGLARTLLNLLVVMFLGGMWHGAAWRYGTWGLLHGLALAGERLLCGPAANARPADDDGRVMRWLRAGFVFAFVSFAWLFFVMPSMEEVQGFLGAVAANVRTPVAWWLGLVLGLYILPVVLYHLLGGIPAIRSRLPAALVEFAYAAMLVAIAFNHGNAAPFIYFQF
jgi:alginate O-acetyltransferase complex protein AlgI